MLGPKQGYIWGLVCPNLPSGSLCSNGKKEGQLAGSSNATAEALGEFLITRCLTSSSASQELPYMIGQGNVYFFQCCTTT